MTSSQSSGKLDESGVVYSAFDQLVSGSDVVIKAMVCRKRDAHNSFGKYLSTHEVLQIYSSTLNMFSDFKPTLSELSAQLHGITRDYDTLKRNSQSRITTLENAKLSLVNESNLIHEQVEGLSADIQKSKESIADLSEQYDSKKSELIFYIQILEREVSSLSTSSLSKEKESLRKKDLEKTRRKLKDTESKLKNAVQEKTRI